MECNLSSQNPMSMNPYPIIDNHICCSARHSLRPQTINVHKTHYSRVSSKLFYISQTEAEIQVIKVELCCDIWLYFALVTVQRCAVCMEMYTDSVIVLLHHTSFQAATHSGLYKFSSKHSSTKTLVLTDHIVELS